MLKDIRYAIRSLLKRPGFTIVAAITLALGIGANSAIFTVVNAVLLRPLPFPQSERIAVVEGINPALGINAARGTAVSNLSVPDFVDWRSQNQVFEQLAGFVTGGTLLTSGDETERVRGTSATGDFFPLLRTNALKGRTLMADDAQPGRDSVAVISFDLWQRRFGADQNIIGTQLRVGSEQATIVGVMPAGFDYPVQTEVWFPLTLDPASEPRDNRYLNVVARLKPGVTPAQAEVELNTINKRLAEAYPVTNSGWTVRVTNLHQRLVGSVRPSLLVLLGAVAFVLLIACANVANLLLARATVRAKEMALRAALGASRARLVRQLLTESLILSIAGGSAGLLLGLWLTKLLIAISPANSPRIDEIRPDLRMVLFTVGLTLLTGVVFGLVPALQSSRVDLNERLKESGRGSTSSHSRMRSLMMVSEIALSFMLLVGAGLLIKSFIRLRDVNPGFNPENLLTLRVTGVSGKYKPGEQRAQFFRQASERLKSLPGVQSVGAVLSLPLGGDTFNLGRGFIREGRPATAEEQRSATYLAVTTEYFRTMQIPLLSGRPFTDQDTNETAKVMVVNETMAKQLWPGESPVGRRVHIWRDEKFPREIVGVVGDVKVSLDEPAEMQMYIPYEQDATWAGLSFVIRTNSDPMNLATAARNEIRALDKSVPTYNVRTVNDLMALSVAPRRTPMLLISAFAGVALLLAMIGIYGVTSYYVTQRTQEIGIRMALGAQMSDVLKLVLKSGMVLAVIGIVIGLVGSFALTRLMSSLLFGVKPTDMLTFSAVALCLLVTALLACYLPARRATKVDPLVALRYE